MSPHALVFALIMLATSARVRWHGVPVLWLAAAAVVLALAAAVLALAVLLARERRPAWHSWPAC